MDIRLRRVYEHPAVDEGTLVLVDRVWPRGLTKDAVGADLWLKEVAPSTALRKWFGHDDARWDEFRRRYFSELDSQPDAVGRLKALAREGRVTLLFSAKDAEHNQAVALREYLTGAAGPR